jgi:hypothetical protein
MTDLDPAAIKARHRSSGHGAPKCLDCPWDDDRMRSWPCEPYRLAAALAEAQERLTETDVAWTQCREERDHYANRAVAAERKLAEAQEREQRVRAVLDQYSDGDSPEECAPEDRWRLYRDLRAILGGDA